MQDNMGAYGTIHDHAGIKEGQTGPNETKWDHKGQKGLNRAILDHTEPYWSILDHTGPCWAMLDHIGPYRSIRDHEEPRGTMRDHKGPL